MDKLILDNAREGPNQIFKKKLLKQSKTRANIPYKKVKFRQ